MGVGKRREVDFLFLFTRRQTGQARDEGVSIKRSPT